MQYQKSKQPAFGQFGQGRNGQAGQIARDRLGQNGNGRAVRGSILSISDNSITVKLQDGSSKVVLVSGNTSISQATPASKNDLKTGEQVAVFGTENSDGSVTAQNVQLNPQQFGLRVSPSPSQ